MKEIEFPHGMADTGENTTEVELVYAGQEVEITETSASFYNQRQKVLVTLNKVLEQDETFGIGMNGEITAVTFGLYAQEDITAADGSIIPADGFWRSYRWMRTARLCARPTCLLAASI